MTQARPTPSTGSSLSCPPRWGTPRRHDRLTHGPRVAAVAAQLGTPLMPWQRHVADVALEVDPDTGRLVYREIVMLTPRQSGKTSLELGVAVHRAFGFPGRQNSVYFAQTRNHARAKLQDDQIPALEASPFAGRFEARLANGSESIRWHHDGSRHGIDAPTEKAGHGGTRDLGFIDEAFAHEDARLEQALKPSMITRPEPQLWVVSTAGTARSTYLRGKVDAGRIRAELGLTADVAYFEWSAPNTANPHDPATWRACMPALGHTITEAAIRSDFATMELDEIRRAYLNQWSDEFPDSWSVIPKETWEPLARPGATIVGAPAMAIDVTPARTYAAVSAVGASSAGGRQVEIVDHRAGTGWLVERCVELEQKHRPSGWVVDTAGPAGRFIPDLEMAGLKVEAATATYVVQATAGFYDDVVDAVLHHLDDPLLTAALAGVKKRPLGDGGWAWGRKVSSADISPLVAATLAHRGHALWGGEIYNPWDHVVF